MDILSWLDNNKEWFFRGAGVSLIAGAGYLIKRYLLLDGLYSPFNKRFRLKVSENPLSDVKGYDFRPKTIFRSIENANPFLAEKINESYIGIEVSWILYFYSIEKSDSGYLITFKVGRKKNYFVSCLLNIEDYPEFKIMQKGSKVLITGVIGKVEFPLIHLEDCEIRW